MQIVSSAYLSKLHADLPMDSKPVWLVRNVCFAGFEFVSSKPKEFGQPSI